MASQPIEAAQTERKPTGRPPSIILPSYDEDKADQLLERIATGESLAFICRDPTMSFMPTIFKWIARDVCAFANRYASAREAQAETLADELVDISDSETDDTNVNRHKLRIETRKWIAAKLLPKKYGERVQVDVEQRISVNVALEQATTRVIEGKAKHIEQQPDDDL